MLLQGAVEHFIRAEHIGHAALLEVITLYYLGAQKLLYLLTIAADSLAERGLEARLYIAQGCYSGRVQILVLRHLDHIRKILAGLRLVLEVLLLQVAAEILYILVRQAERLGRGDGSMLAVVAHGVIKEMVLGIERIAYIHLLRVGEHYIRQDAAGGIALEGVALLTLGIVNSLYAAAGGQVILAGSDLQMAAVCNRTQVLDKSLTEGALADELGATQVLQAAADDLAGARRVFIHVDRERQIAG